jgi:hypothetical protein
MNRGQILDFFSRNRMLFADPKTHIKLRNVAKTPEGLADLNRYMIEMQRGVFPQIGVEKMLGKRILDSLKETHGNDDEIMAISQDFAIQCANVWLGAMREAKPKKLQTSGRMTRSQIINFFDASRYALMLPATTKALEEAFRSSQSIDAPARYSVKLQRSILEDTGVQADFGVSCLNRVGKEFAQDRELLTKMRGFQMQAERAVKIFGATPERSTGMAQFAAAAEQAQGKDNQQAMMQGQETKKKSAVKCKQFLSDTRECSNCGLIEKAGGDLTELKTCARCKLVFYCSEPCQRQHWKKGEHKRFCVAVADRKTSNEDIAKKSTKLISQPHEENVSSEDCAVCLEPLNKSITRTLPCNHVFHHDCMTGVQSFCLSLKCPLCRSGFLTLVLK